MTTDIREINGRWACAGCGREWSALAGDNEIPETCDCKHITGGKMTIENNTALLVEALNKRIQGEVIHRLDIQTDSDWFRELVKELVIESIKELEVQNGK